jgi:hypothetical protein
VVLAPLREGVRHPGGTEEVGFEGGKQRCDSNQGDGGGCAELYAYFIPYPIELLHKSNCDHVALVAALRAGDGVEAVEIARKHVDILHRTMFMGLALGGA